MFPGPRYILESHLREVLDGPKSCLIRPLKPPDSPLADPLIPYWIEFPKLHTFTEGEPGRHRRDCTDTGVEGDAGAAGRCPRSSRRFRLPAGNPEAEQTQIACAGTVRPRRPGYPPQW